ncbi:MAG: S41 family peptidase [Bacteroidota bacterium]
MCQSINLFALLLCFCFSGATLYAQSALPKNMDIEMIAEDEAEAWSTFGQGGDYEILISEEAHSGDHSLSILHVSGADGFRAWGQDVIPEFGGRKLKLTGYLKTENVADGFAGLWLRIDPNVGFDNMAERPITGTNDWQQFEIELDYDENAAQNIAFGCLLVGKGQVWLDDLELTIDGLPFDEAPARELLPAQKDTAFNDGSSLTFDLPLSDDDVRDLSLLGKVWGLLKYHHPKISTGDLNWDFELFRFVPQFQEASDKSAALLEWVESLGPVESCENCAPPENPEVTADHRWLASEHVSSDLRSALQYLIDNRPTMSEHYYISSYSGIGNPQFKNEPDYADMPYPDQGYRYLAAIRYWNMIHYYFPYREEMDIDWDEALADNIPAIVEAENEYAYERAMTRMIGQIQDTHANLWGGGDQVREKRGEYYPPFRAAFVEQKLIVVDYYDPDASPGSDMPQVGDIITHINGEQVGDYVLFEQAFYPASNQAARLRDMAENILRSTDNTSTLLIERNGASLSLTIPLSNSDDLEGYYRWYRTPEGPAYKMLENNIGYLTLANATDEAYAEAKEVFKEARGIIVDIRNYPSAFAPFAFCGFLLKEETPFAMFTDMDMANPGYFSMTETVNIPADEESFDGKVVVLVNELSQSQAEYTAMAFRAGQNTVIIGSQTAGADGNVSRIYLPGGLRTMISGIGVFYPDGTETQRIGIVPDIEVKPAVAGIRAGRDELMERAIAEIMKEE